MPFPICFRTDSRFAPSQWETSSQSNVVSHWLGANLESALCLIGYQLRLSRPSHTAQNSRKRMNHAQISSLTWYISDLRISSVFLTWNLRSCAPMFAVSVLYAIPGFEQLKTRLRVKVCAVLRCFTYFCVVCVVLTRTMRGMCVEYQWSSVKTLPL